MAQAGRQMLALYVFVAAIVRPSDSYLQHDWHFTGFNVAEGRSARQNSNNAGRAAQRAVDDNPAMNLMYESCSQTGAQSPSWWEVDLGNAYIIKGIRIYTTTKYAGKLKNFTIIGYPKEQEIYNDGQKPQHQQKYKNITFKIQVNDSNAYNRIRIGIPGPHLTLCEVQIFGVVTCQLNQMQPEQNFYELDGEYSGPITNNTDISTKCLYGYKWANGNFSRKCQADGKLGGQELQCAPITCQLDQIQPNKTFYELDGVNGSSIEYNTSIRTKCLHGYQWTSGNFTRTCEADGTLSGQELRCSLKTCQLPQLQPHDYFYKFERDYSGSIEYKTVIKTSCVLGYKRASGNFTRECKEDETLSGHELRCSIKTCQLKQLQPKNKFYEFVSNYSGSIEYNTNMSTRCLIEHQRTSGNFTRTCQADGTLSGHELQCSLKTCQLNQLQPDTNFYKFDGNYSDYIAYNTDISTKCLPGYQRTNGNFTRKCQADGALSGHELQCALPAHESQRRDAMVAVAGGAAAAGIAIIILAVLGLMCVMRRRRASAKRPVSDNRHVDRNSSSTGDANTYNEITGAGVEMADVRSGPSSGGAYYNEGEQENAYYCFTNPMRVPDRGIKIEELADFVLSANAEHEKYETEFKSFPVGMTKPHTAALQNKAKNKYRDLYAYDDTKVFLEVWNPKTETDYINANYIHGFGKFKEYIASQGTTKENLNDFWRMVWQTESGKIVMLTNVWEERRVKCLEYWPEKGTKAFGRVAVTLQNTDTFCNFVIRTLIVKKGQEAARRVVQFHFTAWPDRGVPKYSSALVHFRSKVKNAPTACKGPTIVHCSAGIGRTGTYIALDYLTDQGRELGMVDVAGCVEMLRRQRVHMVQTKDQYVFIHGAIVETLMLSTSALPADKFPDTYRDLLAVDPGKRKRKLDLEFEALGSMAPVPDDDQYSNAKKSKYRDKNRYSNTLPIEAYMPGLYGPGKAHKDGYINAAILPSYKSPNAMIITQSPLDTTKEDFWKMVFNQNSNAIVMMNSLDELQESEIYWPQAGQTVNFGNIEVTGVQSEETNGHVVLTLHIKVHHEEHDVKLIQFGHWGMDRQEPDSTGSLLTAIELVQHWQRRSGSHILVVHCMDGTKKSGLFCVLYALLARTVVEHDVAIDQIIQEMRSRREHIIPNVAQFQFCHEVVLEMLKQFDTYSNFSSI